MAVDPSMLPTVVTRMRGDWAVGVDSLGKLCECLEEYRSEEHTSELQSPS